MGTSPNKEIPTHEYVAISQGEKMGSFKVRSGNVRIHQSASKPAPDAAEMDNFSFGEKAHLYGGLGSETLWGISMADGPSYITVTPWLEG